ncbi:hypothetical protein BC828DRAFT_345046 [Blastocladiella britannica]|nr:hypothetical protein BC828DRAFT_345046 [Blastocladiella britannica]
MSTLPIWLNQFLVLLKRNFILIFLRYKKATLAQAVVAPVLFTLLLGLLQRLYVIRQSRETPHPQEYPLSPIPMCQGVVALAPCVTLFYTPSTPDFKLIMNTFAAKNTARGGANLAIESGSPWTASSPAPTSQYGIVPIDNPASIYSYVLANPNTTLFGVDFQAPLPNARYQLWYNSTTAANGTDSIGGLILSMQRAIDEAILAVAGTPNAVANPGSISTVASGNQQILNMNIKDWPTVKPTYVPDFIVSNLGPMFFFCSVMVIFIAVLQDVVTEKELLLRHAMATMGLRASVYWVTMFLSRAVLVAIAALVTVVMGIVCQFTVFTQADFLVLYIVFLLFGLAMVSFAFFITAFCRRARVAVMIGMFVFIIGLVFMSFAFSTAYVGYIWFYSGTPSYIYYLLMHLPFFNFGKLFLDITTLTTGKYDFLTATSIPGPGFPFSALYQPLPSNQLAGYGDNNELPSVPYPASTLNLLIMNIVVYAVLAAYFDKVIPDEYGKAEAPWFFLTPRYWGFGKTAGETLTGFVKKYMPLGDKDEFKVANEDDDVAEERKRAFDENAPAAIRIGNLRKVYRNSMFGASKLDKVAVRSLCLNIEEGQLLALLGQNGAGKSTTMSMLSGLTPPTAGNALIFGKSVKQDMDAIRSQMGICPQHDILFNDLTAAEHVELYGGIKCLSRKEIQRVIDERLEAVRLTKVKNHFAGTYSGGMKRRLSVVVSTIGDPKFLILDEPTTGMDPVNRRAVWGFLEAFKVGRCCILTTHAMEEADALGDRVAVMARGRLHALGTGIRLKNKFGEGYRIGLMTRVENVDAAKAMVTAAVPEATLEDDSAGALVFRLPPSAVHKVPAFIKVLDSPSGKQVVESWGLSQSTLEEVFLLLIRRAVSEDK